MSVLMNFAMFPTDKGSSVSDFVSEIVKMVSESGYDYRLTSMATIVETETMQQSLDILAKAYEILEPQSNRIYSAVTFDIQTNKPNGRISGKIKSVEAKIGEVKK